MKKLTKEQILLLPDKINIKGESYAEIAKEWNVSKRIIDYWVAQLKKRGIKIEPQRQGRISRLEE